MAEVSRKQFVTGAAALGATAALAATAMPAAHADEAGTVAYAETLDWDGRYDVVVVGFGMAGAVAAVYAAKEGANVLLFDAADEWQSGGNSRYSDQYMKSATDYDKMVTFYKKSYREYPYDEGIIDTMANGLVNIENWVAEDLGGNPDDYMAMNFVEFPKHEGCDAITGFFVHHDMGDAAAYLQFRDCVYANADKIDVWYNARATHLVQDPIDKTILGVELEKDGETRRIKADNGVVLACGGFENNQTMMAEYLNVPRSKCIGTLFNRGDGVNMAIEAGAQLWHMGSWVSYGESWLGIDIDETVCSHSRDILASTLLGDLGELHVTGPVSAGITGGPFILVGSDGTRFQNERGETRHGHRYACGDWKMHLTPSRAYYVFDDTIYQEYKDQFYFAVNDIIQQYDSIEAMQEALGMEYLVETVDHFNTCCEMGFDPGFRRDISTMAPIETAPFYAVPLIPRILNTQGGPQRNGQAEVLNPQGEVIPHFYGAGECGGFTSCDYEGGGNLAECVIFGRMAGINAAVPKDDYRMVEGEASAVAPAYTIGSGSSEGNEPRTYDLADNERIGTSRGMGGDIDVKVTLDGDTIVAVEPVYQHETIGVGSQAIAKIPQAIVDAQSTEVDVVTGATITTDAICAAVEAALA